MTEKHFTIQIQCRELASLQNTLESLIKAAKEDELDWGHCRLSAEIEFSTGFGEQSSSALDAFIESQNTPFGTTVEHVENKGSHTAPT